MEQDIGLRVFRESDLEAVYGLVQSVVDVSYRGVYPPEAIELFKEHHSREQVLSEAKTGYTVIAELDNEVVGTGTLLETNVRRVYVSPLHQHTGIGKMIVNEIEKRALSESISSLDLAGSLVSRRFWESLGYEVVKEDYVPVKNNKKLHFYRMVKSLPINESSE